MTLEELKSLSGLGQGVYARRGSSSLSGSNISITGTEKSRLQKKHSIEPGTPAWFRLWFALPFLTGEKPVASNVDRK